MRGTSADAASVWLPGSRPASAACHELGARACRHRRSVGSCTVVSARATQLTDGLLQTGDDEDWSPRYGVVLALIFASFVFLSAAPTTNWAILASVALQAVTLIVTLHTSRARPLVMRLGVLGALLALVAAISLLVVTDPTSPESSARSGSFAITALIVLFTPPVITLGVLRDIRFRGAVTGQAVFGAISVYLLIGIFFSGAYGAVASVGAEPFFADGTDGDNQSRLYFSFVTLTTLGYGDFAPAVTLGRTFAMVEALLGQIYLVTIIAVLVGNLGRGVLRREG